jgi:cytochrome bd-type quinol oxidase subunit 2
VSKADAAAAILWVGATFYALFGGADFGGGFWDLIAGGPERGQRPRDLIQRSLTPVWEANHVWLIFVLVVLWTAFPSAFSAIFTTLYVPIALAALGIVLFLFSSGGAFVTRWSQLAVGLVLGGALGNLLDRLFREGHGFLGGRVVDFVDIQMWPVWNVADMAISVGAVLLALTADAGRSEQSPE